jgi:hypothetical protein
MAYKERVQVLSECIRPGNCPVTSRQSTVRFEKESIMCSGVQAVRQYQDHLVSKTQLPRVTQKTRNPGCLLFMRHSVNVAYHLFSWTD